MLRCFHVAALFLTVGITLVHAQSDPVAHDHSPSIPLSIGLFSTRQDVEAMLAKRGLQSTAAQAIEGLGPSLHVTNVEWNNAAFDTMHVYFSPAGGANAVMLVRTCDDDKIPLVVAELSDVAAHTYGEPTFADETSARWERGGEAAVSIGPTMENDAVWLRFDLVPIHQRRTTTKPAWPLAIPSVSDRDEVVDILTDSCRKATEEGDAIVSAGCSCFGIKAKRTSVSLDGEGRPSTIEMVVSRADNASLMAKLGAMYGTPRENGSWYVDDLQAVSVADGDDGLVVTFFIPVIELRQYMAR